MTVDDGDDDVDDEPNAICLMSELPLNVKLEILVCDDNEKSGRSVEVRLESIAKNEMLVRGVVVVLMTLSSKKISTGSKTAMRDPKYCRQRINDIKNEDASTDDEDAAALDTAC